MKVPVAAPLWCGELLAAVPVSQQHRVHRHEMSPYVRTPDGSVDVFRCRCGFAALAPPGGGPAPVMPHWMDLLEAASACPPRCQPVAQVLVMLAGVSFAA